MKTRLTIAILTALAPFLAKMAAMTARPLATFDTAPTYLQQTMTFVAPAPPRGAPEMGGCLAPAP
jgi:hypothetical protein